MQHKLSRALLKDTHYPVSAAISIGRGGEVLGVHLFDTQAFTGRMRIRKKAEEIWLMSNHFEGCETPYEEDLKNLSRLLLLAGTRRVRFFLTSEYYACREIGLSGGEWNVL